MAIEVERGKERRYQGRKTGRYLSLIIALVEWKRKKRGE